MKHLGLVKASALPPTWVAKNVQIQIRLVQDILRAELLEAWVG